MTIFDDFHDIIFSGGIKKGGSWGGPGCVAAVPLDTHHLECLVWTLISMVIFLLIDIPKLTSDILAQSSKHISANPLRKGWRVVDFMFGAVHAIMWLQVLYYKINLRSLVNLLQPCHLALFFEGVALLVDGPVSILITQLTLPLLTGAVSALANPATDGLDQPFEEISFFIQHYLLLVTPFYLLCRHNHTAVKTYSFKLFMYSNWVELALHWFFFAHFDRYFQVNINFFLCPAEGMIELFKSFPHLIWPTYRTFLSILMLVLSVPLCYGYVYGARLLSALTESHPKEN